MNAIRLHPTGDVTLDQALGGGLRGGLILLCGEEGAGADEFALGLLHAQWLKGSDERVLHVSASRAGDRVKREIQDVFGDEKGAASVEYRWLAPRSRDFYRGPTEWADAAVVVLESAASIAPLCPRGDIAELGAALGDMAATSGALIVLVCSEGAIPSEMLARLKDAADGVFTFRWRHGVTMSRRLLQITKLRGIPPAVEGEGAPVFEISLQQGAGVLVSRVTNVV